MIGLSLSAIGMRPLEDCLAIADELAGSLPVQFIELAIGVSCETSANYGEWPLVLHDNCLRGDSGRLRLDPLRPKTWAPYLAFTEANDVLAIGVHSPAKKQCTLSQLDNALADMEQAFGIPVHVEVMPGKNRWCSSLDSLPKHSLLLDLSHVLLWTRGDLAKTEKLCHQVLDRFEVGEIHLSHNDGMHDCHDLIPASMWFEPLIGHWTENHLVTYESLPNHLAKHRRLDQARYARIG